MKSNYNDIFKDFFIVSLHSKKFNKKERYVMHYVVDVGLVIASGYNLTPL